MPAPKGTCPEVGPDVPSHLLASDWSQAVSPVLSSRWARVLSVWMAAWGARSFFLSLSKSQAQKFNKLHHKEALSGTAFTKQPLVVHRAESTQKVDSSSSNCKETQTPSKSQEVSKDIAQEFPWVYVLLWANKAALHKNSGQIPVTTHGLLADYRASFLI